MGMPSFKKSSSAPSAGDNAGQSNSRKDITLIESLRNRIFAYWLGSCWVRIMPGIAGSTRDTFMVKVPILKRGRWQAVCPSFFGQRSLFREAHKAVKDAAQGSTLAAIRYDKDKNPSGFRSWPGDFFALWVLGISPESSRYQLLIANASDGTYGPAQLGHKIIVAATRANDDPSLPESERGKLMFEDVSAIETGHHMNIKKLGEGSSSSYDVEFSPKASDITGLITGMPALENETICPIELALHCPTLEEQKEILTDLMGAAAFAEVFPDL